MIHVIRPHTFLPFRDLKGWKLRPSFFCEIRDFACSIVNDAINIASCKVARFIQFFFCCVLRSRNLTWGQDCMIFSTVARPAFDSSLEELWKYSCRTSKKTIFKDFLAKAFQNLNQNSSVILWRANLLNYEKTVLNCVPR